MRIRQHTIPNKPNRLLPIVFALQCLTGSATAATLTVTRGDDPIADGCRPGDCSLREAILQANTTATADLILFEVTTVDLDLTGTDDIGLVGDLDVHEPLTLNGSPNGVTIDANGIDRVLDALPGAVVMIESITLTGGNDVDLGGGIRVQDADLTLDASTVSQNSAINAQGTGYGGGIFAMGNASVTLLNNSAVTENTNDLRGGIVCFDSSLTLEDSSITFNQGGQGAGISSFNCDLVATNSILAANTASSTGGGLSLIGGTTTWTGGVIGGDVGNQATYGGAIHAQGNLVLNNVRIENNTASDQGGGLFLSSGLTQITGSLIRNNTAVQSGGGLGVVGSAELTIAHSLIEGNQAPGGGGINISANVVLSNTTLSSNSASQGGAIAFEGAGSLDADHVTFSSNSATFGSAIQSLSSLTPIELSNSIIRGNCVILSTVMSSQGGNIESPSDSCHLGSGTNDLVNIDTFGLRFFGLADNGGPTQTHAIGGSSVARNNGVCNGICELSDQRLFERFDGLPDSGAYEFGTGPIFMDSFEDG